MVVKEGESVNRGDRVTPGNSAGRVPGDDAQEMAGKGIQETEGEGTL